MAKKGQSSKAKKGQASSGTTAAEATTTTTTTTTETNTQNNKSNKNNGKKQELPKNPSSNGAKSNGTATKKTTTTPTPTSTTNGSTSGTNTSTSTNASSNSGLSILHLILAILSLIAGILAPHFWELSQLSTTSTSTSSSSTSNRHRQAETTKSTAQTQTQNNKRMMMDTSLDDDNSYGIPQYSCDEATLSNFLHENPVPGMHVVCIQKGSLIFFKDSVIGKSEKATLYGSLQPWGTLKHLLITHLGLTPQDSLHQPWATFTPDGYKLLMETDADTSSIDRMQQLGMFLVFQGGQWIWPGVKKGFQRTVSLGLNQNATLVTLSLHPLVVSVHGFLSQEECEYIQSKAEPSMRYSQVTLMDHDKGRPASDFRTSQTTFLRSQGLPELEAIDHRTAALVRIPANHQEAVQVLRYGYTEKYDTHHDYFDPSLYQQDPRTLSMIQNGKRNRMVTVFWYLSDVPQGGETVFPRYDKGPQPALGATFDQGLKVKPERGKVIIFYSMTPDGKLDPYSLHGAAPVKEGIKWAANKWVWNLPNQFG